MATGVARCSGGMGTAAGAAPAAGMVRVGKGATDGAGGAADAGATSRAARCRTLCFLLAWGKPPARGTRVCSELAIWVRLVIPHSFF